MRKILAIVAYDRLAGNSGTGAYGAVIPDLPGCTAMGNTFEETITNASEAAEEWSRDTSGVISARSEGELRADPSLAEDFAHDAVVVAIDF